MIRITLHSYTWKLPYNIMVAVLASEEEIDKLDMADELENVTHRDQQYVIPTKA